MTIFNAVNARSRILLLTLLASITWVQHAQAGDAGHWLPTWTASPQPIWASDFVLPLSIPPSLKNQTVRQVLRTSLGGSRVRVLLSNEYGSHPLEIGAAHIAPAGAAAGSVSGAGQALTFGGKSAVTIPAGAPVLSDPVEMAVPPLSQWAISLYFPQNTPLTTIHWEGLQSAQIVPGNAVNAPVLKTASTLSSRLFLSSMLVDTAADARAVVIFGDSITDGAASTPNADRRWPDFLAQRLAKDKVAVLNAGISGARLLKNHMGMNALARFERDVLSQPGVTSVLLLMGINDISWPGSTFEPDHPPTPAEDVIAAYRQLIARAHSRKMRIVGGTLTPFQGALTMKDSPVANYYSPAKEVVRQQVNQWIRQSGEFDAVLDFDAVVRDPLNPLRLRPAYDAGDHLHLSDAGNQAVADSVNPKLLLGDPDSK